MNAVQEYIAMCAAAEALIAAGNVSNATIVIQHHLAATSKIEAAASEVFLDTDLRRAIFVGVGPDALDLILGQLEDSAAAACALARTILTEASAS